MSTPPATAPVIPVENLAEWRGQDVVDPGGDKLGKLEALYYDAEVDEPAFVAVKAGTFGKHLTLVPLAGASVGRDFLRVDVPKDRFKKAPSFDPDAELSQADEAGAYEHYGIAYAPAGQGARRLARR
jgi:hypothetical protein